MLKDYQDFLAAFLNHLDQHTQSLKSMKPRELYDPEEYILSLGGKRVRPLLALIGCDLFDKEIKLALDSALAVELFHNFSLIHDDILDAAPLRRNKATVHHKWNNNIAILSGDVMLVKSFQCLQNYPDQQFKSLSTLFTRTAVEVCEGQQMDMNFENESNVTVESYLEMISKKTAVLLGCSLQMGAINGGASEDDQKNVYEFGKHLGIAFQLLDDLLDAFAENSEKFGKQTGGDIIANKKTFLSLKALETATVEQKKKLEDLSKLNNASEKVEQTLKIFQDLKVKDACKQEANHHTDAAIAALEKISAKSSKKNSLKNFALELLDRQM